MTFIRILRARPLSRCAARTALRRGFARELARRDYWHDMAARAALGCEEARGWLRCRDAFRALVRAVAAERCGALGVAA